MPASPPRPQASARAGEFRLAQDGPDGFWAFHPRPLPPDPPLRVDVAMQTLLDRANQALGRLDGVTLLLPDPDQFIYTFVRKEAVLSSQIEGTQPRSRTCCFSSTTLHPERSSRTPEKPRTTSPR